MYKRRQYQNLVQGVIFFAGGAVFLFVPIVPLGGIVKAVVCLAAMFVGLVGLSQIWGAWIRLWGVSSMGTIIAILGLGLGIVMMQQADLGVFFGLSCCTGGLVFLIGLVIAVRN